MSEFLKPQSPLQHKDGAYIYPLTTADQVILEDNTRLNAALEDIKDKVDNIDFSNLDLEGVAYVGETLDSAVAPINADTLGGKPASEYVTKEYVASECATKNDIVAAINEALGVIENGSY